MNPRHGLSRWRILLGSFGCIYPHLPYRGTTKPQACRYKRDAGKGGFGGVQHRHRKKREGEKLRHRSSLEARCWCESARKDDSINSLFFLLLSFESWKSNIVKESGELRRCVCVSERVCERERVEALIGRVTDHMFASPPPPPTLPKRIDA